jgi:hypothetical protein
MVALAHEATPSSDAKRPASLNDINYMAVRRPLRRRTAVTRDSAVNEAGVLIPRRADEPIIGPLPFPTAAPSGMVPIAATGPCRFSRTSSGLFAHMWLIDTPAAFISSTIVWSATPRVLIL